MIKLFRTLISIIMSAALLLVASSGYCARSERDYVIEGKIQLEDGTPLVNVKVIAGGNTTNSRTLNWNRWDDSSALTDSDGHFRIIVSKSKKKRRIRVWMKLANDRLSVREYLADAQSNFRPVAETDSKTDDADIDFGEIVIGGKELANAHTEAVRNALTKVENVTRAEIYSVMHRVYKKMRSYGNGLEYNPNKKIIAYYPVSDLKASWAIGNTINLVKRSRESTWIHELGHTWIYQHDSGTWLCGWGKHEDMCPDGAFNEGYAEYFSRSLMLILGYSDKEGEARLDMDKFDLESSQMAPDELERDMKGVVAYLQMMTNPTLCEHYGYKCDDPEIAFEDVSRVFLPAPEAGWETNWEVGRNEYGIWRFVERAVDILPQFTEEYANLIKARLDSGVSEDDFHARFSSIYSEPENGVEEQEVAHEDVVENEEADIIVDS